jgi:hypothetical protein
MSDPGDGAAPAPPALPALPRGALGAWWAQGARSAFLLPPRWDGLPLTPAVLACLALVPTALGVGLERLLIEGPAAFYWPALLSRHWMTFVVWLGASWLVAGGERGDGRGVAARFAMLCAQSLPLLVLTSLLLLPAARGADPDDATAMRLAGGVGYACIVWVYAAEAVLLCRQPAVPWRPRALAVLLVVVAGLLQEAFAPVVHWYPARPARAAEPAFRPRQETFEAQAAALERDLAAMAPPRPGAIDVYAITYAPDAGADVFRRESDLVAGVMEQRFGARAVQLVSRRETEPRRAWATPPNLRRAIERVAAKMDRDEDVLFIHLTSHGARSGLLASSFAPLDVPWLQAQTLKGWLDAAGVRNRVISVSACYSGTWLGPLADANTLVMTAADSEHTSYGCGLRSELTFFGRAMYDEELRRTWSFEQAHAAARTTIAAREREAGKSDGYSNPQIAVGAAIRPLLERLAAERASAR